jgi:hypothetical protein
VKKQVRLKYDENNKLFTCKTCIFMISQCTVLGVRNVSDKSCGENQNTHFMCGNPFPKIGGNV